MQAKHLRRLGAAAALVAAAACFATTRPGTAYADPAAPPPFPSNCPGPSYPTTTTAAPYEVPFKGIIYGGEITLPPGVEVPHIYASICGLVQLPQLSGTITGSNMVVATPNVYIGTTDGGSFSALEDLPVSVSFPEGLQASISLTPAPNGGLDITVNGSTLTSVTTLGMTCQLTLNAVFTTQTSGALTGQPVTGPTEDGQAEVVSNSFSVPTVQGSDSGLCPPSIAQTFNKLLGLPAPAGVGSFTAPFCFDFELEGPNNPVRTPGSPCPWPS